VAYKRLTSQEKEEIIRLYVEEEKSTREISKIYGVSGETVRQVLIDRGISRRKRGPKPFYKKGKVKEEDVLRWPPERAELFWAKVNRRGRNECWEWQGYHDKNGYGNHQLGGRNFLTHRIAWILSHRKLIPPGLCVMHVCDNPPCCNPSHLKLGTKTENSLDMVRKGRSARGEKHWHARLSAEEVLRIRELRRSGIPISELASKFDVSRMTIYDIAARKNWTHIGGPVGTRPREELKGERNPSAKLTRDAVVKIREKRYSGEHISVLVNEFGVSESTIRSIVTGRTWRHVGGPIRGQSEVSER